MWTPKVRRGLGGLLLASVLIWPAMAQASSKLRSEAVTVPEVAGLLRPASIFWDGEGVPHILAHDERDAFFLLGYAHAKDRFFQIDFYRRLFSGTLSEMVGGAGLGSDIQFRRWDLDRGAQESYEMLPRSSRRLLDAYAAGINVFLARNALPVEYGALELDIGGVPAWRAQDSLLLLKGFSLSSWLDLSDITRSTALEAYRAAGVEQGFDGDTLFDEDVFRAAPIEPEVTVPGAITASPKLVTERGVEEEAFRPQPETLELARRLIAELRELPMLAASLDGDHGGIGSNWWLVAGRHTESGRAMLANDPHQFLSLPPVLYEVELLARRAEGGGPSLDVIGVTFAGVPAVVTGCNRRICWGATNNRLDLTDVFEEQVLFDSDTGLPSHTVFQGRAEPLRVITHRYRANLLGDGVPSNFEVVPVGDLEGGKSFHVRRRNGGPLISIGTPDGGTATGLSVQYAGFSGSLDVEAFLRWQRAQSLSQFQDGLRFADGFVFNMAYADVRGSIGYFATGELPLRDDLQNLGRADGAPPWLIRDGSGDHRHEWLRAWPGRPDRSLRYEVLPLAEMPSVVNPESGWLVSANNDPVGTSIDNDPLNQSRPGGGVLYFDRSFVSLRAAQIRRLLEAELALGPLDDAVMKRLQSDQRLPDAAIALPFLLDAWAAATAPGAPAVLSDLAAEPRMAEAVARLAAWDHSTPTGILEGYDAGDDPDDLQPPEPAEVDRSVAATLFSVWRGQLVRRVVDQTFEGLGLGAVLPPSRQAHVATLHLLRTFDASSGRGASGVRFFAFPGVEDPVVARDAVLLDTLRRSLEALAGEPFARAFEGSQDLADYRWGKLHRITLAHPLGGPFSVPPIGGFMALGPGLPGLARAGGFETVDTGSHDVRAADDSGFRFTLSPGRRFFATLDPAGIRAFQILPGGQSGDPTTAEYTGQLGRWLTNRYAPVLDLRFGHGLEGPIETFLPAP